MPSLLTHAFFAKDFVEKHKMEDSLIARYSEAFRLGSQGPDPLFFYGLWPKRGLKLKIAKEAMGSQIHKSDGIQLFTTAFEQIDSIDDTVEKDVFTAFILGQFAHYMLDSHAHSYVYYWSGFDKRGKLSGIHHYRHGHFEATIDSVLANERRKPELTRKPETVLIIPSAQLELINKHFVKVLEDFFSKKLPSNFYADAVNNMIDIYRLANGGTCLRHHFFGHTSLGQIYIPTRGNPIVMNLDHLTWKNPSQGTNHKETFLDLFNKAQDDMEIAYANIVQNGLNIESVNPVMKGLNYSGIPMGKTNIYKDVEEKLYPRGNRPK